MRASLGVTLSLRSGCPDRAAPPAAQPARSVRTCGRDGGAVGPGAGFFRGGAALALLAALAVATARGDDGLRRVPGELRRDGLPWPGGRVRLQLVSRKDWRAPLGAPVQVVADARGAFEARLASGPHRFVPDAGWPAGASLRCELGEAPHAPEDDVAWVGCADTCRALIHDEDTPLVIDVLSPVPVVGEVSGAAPDTRVEVLVEGQPVAGCAVDAAGRFALDVPAWVARRVRGALVARAPARGPAGASPGLVADDEGGVAPPPPVTLALDPTPVRCAGVVRDLDGRPVPGARVGAELRLRDARDPADSVGLMVEVACDEAGAFAFDAPRGSGWTCAGPDSAVVDLHLSAPGFRDGFAVHAFGPGCGGAEGVLLRAGLSLSGVVLDAAGQPLGGARVIGDEGEVQSGVDGRFELVTKELDEVVVVADGHAPRAFRARLPVEGLEVRLSQGAPPDGDPRRALPIELRPTVPARGAWVELPLDPR